MPGVDVVDSAGKRVRRARSVLVLAELPISVSRRLKDRGAELAVVESVRDAIDLLASRDFDAAIVDTLIANATAMVKNLKMPVRFDREAMAKAIDEDWPAYLPRITPEERKQLVLELSREDSTAEGRAFRRHALTPMFMILPGDETYAIIVRPPEHSYLEDGHGISLPDAVMTLDVGKLLLRGAALA